jgi:two-component system, LytTR family, response regulator
MITVGIIDDEKANRSVIKNILTEYCAYANIIVEDGLIESSVKELNLKKPEVIFLDIELKNGTGFDILTQLNYKPEVIFTTAYSQYAINAIKIKAFDYILKPINEEELVNSLKNCKEKILNAKEFAKNALGTDTFYNIATNEGKLSLNFNDILYFEGSGSYTYCVTVSKKILFSKNIGEVEKEIASSLFFRTHHSYIVNLTKINRIEIKRNGKLFLNNNESIPLSQRKIKEFKIFFQSKIIK